MNTETLALYVLAALAVTLMVGILALLRCLPKPPRKSKGPGFWEKVWWR